jgi:hypothetical protein
MSSVSPLSYYYFSYLYAQGKLNITSAQVMVNGTVYSASASILAVNTAAGAKYVDLIIDFVINFNTPSGGTLQQINISMNASISSTTTVGMNFCSSENQQVPPGAVQITKRYIVRWYTS